MTANIADNNTQLPVDAVITDIAEYVRADQAFSDESLATARLCLLDALGCGMLALTDPKCRRVLGPIVPGAAMADGCLVPGTNWRLDPLQAAFNVGAMVRWLDFNDTWLAAEWGHPSDNLGGLLPAAAWLSRQHSRQAAAGAGIVPRPVTFRQLLEMFVRAYEVQGVLALDNAFNRVGLDHVLLVRVATAAVTSAMLSGQRQHVISAVTNAFADGGALRTYRHAPNTGSRKSWAAGDATRRGLWLAMMAARGEMEYRTVLSAPRWGFQDTLFGSADITLARPLDSYVMDNILFKVSYPAEFHAKTAVEAAVQLHPMIVNRLDQIDRIELHTQESAIRIISKSGPLHNPADRDHCLQYMVAIALLKGDLTAADYEDDIAADPRVDQLRDRMHVTENEAFSRDYLDPDRRSIANAVQVHFQDGSSTPRIEVEYPLGHCRRRDEARSVIEQKFSRNVARHLPSGQCDNLSRWMTEPTCFDDMPVHEFVELWHHEADT
ncbi:MAG: bifunctional 2-methylcitrate dehydratase/aconitate hydratase [Planctomycetaceae bacterium]|nr:bifunctional 2-methylcitrate dehydratase/aconitate hydratase [Planctomycetaceae bacterium]